MFISSIDAPSDYGAVSTTVTFEECDRRHCFDISITDDEMVEKRESFTVLLNRTAHLDSRVELERVISTVVITDTDSRHFCVLFRCSFIEDSPSGLCFVLLLSVQEPLYSWRTRVL